MASWRARMPRGGWDSGGGGMPSGGASQGARRRDHCLRIAEGLRRRRAEGGAVWVDAADGRPGALARGRCGGRGVEGGTGGRPRRAMR